MELKNIKSKEDLFNKMKEKNVFPFKPMKKEDKEEEVIPVKVSEPMKEIPKVVKLEKEIKKFKN